MAYLTGSTLVQLMFGSRGCGFRAWQFAYRAEPDAYAGQIWKLLKKW